MDYSSLCEIIVKSVGLALGIAFAKWFSVAVICVWVGNREGNRVLWGLNPVASRFEIQGGHARAPKGFARSLHCASCLKEVAVIYG
jgi:hypothetical protein